MKKINNLSGVTIKTNIDPVDLVDIIIKNRGIKKNEISEFLKPSYPENFNVDFSKAISRINEAIAAGQEILIYGDYDVDGITSTAILWQVLFNKGAKVTPFIPDRENDGYGVRSDSVFKFEKEKNIHFDLLITVDNGIVAHKEIEIIQKKGCEVIVVDHHQALDKTPKGAIVVHSQELSGSGLTWFLAKNIDKSADLGLAALGTVADCLPLLKTNRSLVTHGTADLRLNPSPGIKKLIEVSGCKQTTLSAYDMGFLLGPRINAVGRMSNPTDALRLLCSRSEEQAGKYARILDSFNRERQGLQKEHVEMAEKMVENGKKIMVVSSKEFNPGIIGLIAGKLTEKYNMPSIVISIEGKVAKGSCRSIAQINIIETLREFSHLFINLGGHAAAAGFSIEVKKIKTLKALIEKRILEKLEGKDLEKTIEVDAEMEIGAVKVKNIESLAKLEPFGVGNPKPMFYFKNLKIVSKKVIGATGDHLKLKVDDPTTERVEYLATEAIAFKKGELSSQLEPGDRVDIIASLDLNIWQGNKTPQLIVKEIIKST